MAEHEYVPASASVVCTTLSPSEIDVESNEEVRLMLPPLVKATVSLLHVSTTVVSAECVVAHCRANPLPILTLSSLGRVVVNTVGSEREKK